MPLSKTKKALGEGRAGGPTVDMLLLAHPAPEQVPERGPEAGPEREGPIVLLAPCPAVQSLTPIPLDLGLDHTLHLRKGIVITRGVVLGPHPVPPLPRCPAPLPGGGGTPIPPLALAHGVAPGRGPAPLAGQHSGEEADCTVPHMGPAVVDAQNQTWKT